MSAQHVHPHRGRLVIDRNVIGLHDESRPGCARGGSLAEREVGSAAGKLDRVELRRAHGVGGRRDPRLTRAAGDGDRQGDAYDQRSNGVHIGLLVCAGTEPPKGRGGLVCQYLLARFARTGA